MRQENKGSFSQSDKYCKIYSNFDIAIKYSSLRIYS